MVKKYANLPPPRSSDQTEDEAFKEAQHVEQTISFMKERHRRAVRRLIERGMAPSEALAAVEARTGDGDDDDDFGFGSEDGSDAGSGGEGEGEDDGDDME
eukprot:TRINITY_DN9478_c0_g3_i1.p2 TRINITY_DN9478_c0_g3~~TRINITY_DN9478_c0_g3_i1.p2  ORF type:complete len:114 (-),score=41.41 TRINITY_DN9478_c0_g3_i1:119-418(-)